MCRGQCLRRGDADTGADKEYPAHLIMDVIDWVVIEAMDDKEEEVVNRVTK